MREIEIKARVKDKAVLLKKLAGLDLVLGTAKKHHDVVFCKPGQQDYEPDSIWLRIRTEDDTTITWTLKQDTGRRMDSIEHEVEVSDGAELEKMLRLMGMELYSDLTKTRQKAKYGDIEICIDELEGAGTFIEVEKLFDDHEIEYQAVADELWRLLRQLGIDREAEVREGYDVLLKNARVATL